MTGLNDPIIQNALMTFGAGFTGAMFAKAQGPGRALDDIMSLIGFEKLHEVAEKKRAKRDFNIQQFKESIAQNIIKIPEENIQEPPLAIVGPALEASKFYIEEDTLREMFAKLIAASMNSQDSEAVHAAYVEIIKQLSPLDAQNLYFLNKGPNEIANVRIIFESGSFIEVVQNLYLGNPDVRDNKLISPSLVNLHRLGLISIEYGTYTFNDSVYDSLRNTEEYLQYQQMIENIQYSKKAIEDNILSPESLGKLIEYKEIKLVKGLASVTPFGKNFCRICLAN